MSFSFPYLSEPLGLVSKIVAREEEMARQKLMVEMSDQAFHPVLYSGDEVTGEKKVVQWKNPQSVYWYLQ